VATRRKTAPQCTAPLTNFSGCCCHYRKREILAPRSPPSCPALGSRKRRFGAGGDHAGFEVRQALLPNREPDTQIIEYLQHRIYELEEQLGARTEFPPILGLTLSEEALLGAIFKREVVTQNAAFAILYGSKADGEIPSDPKNVVSVLIMRLRKKISPHGIDIKTRTGVGYYMTGDAKNRLRRITERASQEQSPLDCTEPEGERAVL
jgi:hypothetical protein